MGHASDPRVCPRCGSRASRERWCGTCGLNLELAGDLPTAEGFAAKVRERAWLEQEGQRDPVKPSSTVDLVSTSGADPTPGQTSDHVPARARAEFFMMDNGWVIAHPSDPRMLRFLVEEEWLPIEDARAVVAKMAELAAERDASDPGWDMYGPDELTDEQRELLQRRRLSSSTCIRAQNASTIALSKHDPLVVLC
jgi:hypothetical protein